MILTDIKRYLQERGQASLSDIALHFDAEPDAVRGMLEIWERKGRVSHSQFTPDCGSSCSKCGDTQGEVYRWVGSDEDELPPLPVGCISTRR